MAQQKKPNDNILIGYTKWLLKWILIIALIIGLGFGGFIYYDTTYEKAEVTMFYMSCISDGKDEILDKEFRDLEREEETFFYRVTKKRNEDGPFGVYATGKETTNEKGEPKLFMQIGRYNGYKDEYDGSDYMKVINKLAEKYDEPFYFFHHKIYEQLVDGQNTIYDFVGRKSLTRFRFSDKRPNPIYKYNCSKTTKEIYEKKLKEENAYLKEYQF